MTVSKNSKVFLQREIDSVLIALELLYHGRFASESSEGFRLFIDHVQQGTTIPLSNLSKMTDVLLALLPSAYRQGLRFFSGCFPASILTKLVYFAITITNASTVRHNRFLFVITAIEPFRIRAITRSNRRLSLNKANSSEGGCLSKLKLESVIE